LKYLEGRVGLSGKEEVVAEGDQPIFVEGIVRRGSGLFQLRIPRPHALRALGVRNQHEQIGSGRWFWGVVPSIFFSHALGEIIRDVDAVVGVGQDGYAFTGIGKHDQDRLRAFVGAVVAELFRILVRGEKETQTRPARSEASTSRESSPRTERGWLCL